MVFGGMLFLAGCSSYGDKTEKAEAILTSSNTTITVGDTVQLDGSQSVYNTIAWTINGEVLDFCGSSSVCDLQMNTAGSFEITIEATKDSTATASVLIQVNAKTSEASKTVSATTSSSSTVTATPMGKLTYQELHKDVAAGGAAEGLDYANCVTVSPDNQNVYATGSTDSALVVFTRNLTTGALTYLETHKDVAAGGAAEGLGSANCVIVSPDGKSVYATGGNDNAVVVFSRNLTTGALTYVERHRDVAAGGTAEGLSSASHVIVSPDNKSVYVAGIVDDAVVVFSRDLTTGVLTYVEQQRDVANGGSAEGLDGARYISVSADNKNVYAVGKYDSALVVFSRNLTTGALTYVETFKDISVGGSVEGLDYANFVTVSPDDKNVYVAAANDSAVVVFSRNLTTGALTPVEAYRDLSTGGSITGLAGVSTAIVSPDGKNVYATGNVSDAVVVFTRDLTTGVLTYVETHKDVAAGGADEGLDGVVSLAVSSDNKSVYAAARNDDAVVVFSRE